MVKGQSNISQHSGIVMVGAFPPPIVGLSLVNQAVYERLKSQHAHPYVIDVSSPDLERSGYSILARANAVARGMISLITIRSHQARKLYVSISGGMGRLYELLFLLIARWRGLRIYLHHHSSAYLDIPSLLTILLVKMAGPNALHILQSRRLAEKFRDLYGAQKVTHISNAAFFFPNDAPATARKRVGLRTLGFLSNISEEKGIFDFLDLMAEIESQGIRLQGSLAGPFMDSRLEKLVRDRMRNTDVINYVGPKYGKEKDAFYHDIDLFVFPTRYNHETEGIVVHEAMSHGLPVVAYGRGAIPEIVGPDCGLVIDPGAPFVPAALERIRLWYERPELYRAASSAAIKRFNQIRQANALRWEKVMQSMMNGEDAEASLPWEASALD